MSTWLQRLSPRPDAATRLFCFHHAGGSAAAFRLWPRKLTEFDVSAVQLPGRANRFIEPAMTDLRSVIDALVPEILPLLDRPFLLFGHSMGSAVASALASRLRALGAPLPQCLFVSGRQPPHLPFPEWSMRGLSDDAVIRSINKSFGGFPPEVLSHPELVEMMLPTLRADFALLENYRPASEPPLPVPIIALGGSADPCADAAHLEPWQDYSTLPLRMRHVPGDHFYLDAGLEDVLAIVRAEASRSRADVREDGMA